MPNTVSITDVIIESYDIEDVIRKYRPSYTRGGLISCLCRGHSDSTPSTKVYTDTHSTYCFGCGRALNPVTLVMEQEDCSYQQARDKLREMFPSESKELEEKIKKLPKDKLSSNDWENKVAAQREKRKDYEHMKLLEKKEIIDLIREYNREENDKRRSRVGI